MKAQFWLAVSAKHYGIGRWTQCGVPKVSKGKPAIGKDQVAIKIDLDIPDAYFEEPQIALAISMPEQNRPPLIDITMKSGIAELIEKQLGVKVHLSADGVSESRE